MLILAIDPGSEQNAWLVYDTVKSIIRAMGYSHREMVADYIVNPNLRLGCVPDYIAIEDIEYTGQYFNRTLGANCRTIGYLERAAWEAGRYVVFYTARQTRLAICGNASRKESQLKQAMIDFFGGEIKAVGGKKCQKCKGKGWFGAGRPTCTKCKGKKWEYPPGPLYALKNEHNEHLWSALAVAITAATKIGV